MQAGFYEQLKHLGPAAIKQQLLLVLRLLR
jgi:hypothetical protein